METALELINVAIYVSSSKFNTVVNCLIKGQVPVDVHRARHLEFRCLVVFVVHTLSICVVNCWLDKPVTDLTTQVYYL